MTGDRGFLLVRRRGTVFGIANAAVDGLQRRDGAYRVRLAANGTAAGVPDGVPSGDSDDAVHGVGTLCIDEVVGVVPELAVRPLSPLVCAFWPEASAGCAVWGTLPLVVVDPQCPPRALTLEEEVAT